MNSLPHHPLSQTLKKFLRIVFYVLGGIVVLFAADVAVSLWSMNRQHDNFAATKNDLPTYVAGRWDWTTHAHLCADSAHTIRFRDNDRIMEIRQEGALGKGGDADPTVYDVLEITPSRIRGAIRGESRKTAQGKPVVWDLVMFTVNEYHWHRTDWGTFGYTPAVVRCRSVQDGGGIAPPST